jgi:hypothetical protein
MDFSHEFSRINTNLKSALVDFKLVLHENFSRFSELVTATCLEGMIVR